MSVSWPAESWLTAWPWLAAPAWCVARLLLLKAGWCFGRYQKRTVVLMRFFCNYVNESYTFSGSSQLYVCTQPCFAKLQQASDKLESVVTIINELKAKSGRVGDTAMSGSTSLSSYVHSVSTPTSSLVTKRATTSQQPRAKKLLRLEVNSVIINDLQYIYLYMIADTM